MAPVKNKKKVSAASKSMLKDFVSGKKLLKEEKKTVIPSKSSLEEVVSDKKVKEETKDGDAKESVPTPKVKKPCTWLKLDRLNPPIGSKSSLQSSKQSKEANMTTQVQASKDNKRKRNEEGVGKGHHNPKKCEESEEKGHHNPKKGEEKGHNNPSYEKRTDSRPEKKEKETVNDRHEDTKRDEESEKILGGLIFMCNAKTKPDCFKYQLMGVSVSKKDVVVNIKPGLKIFLYDYDLKLMYGVFEASSAGGMKLEPAAFGGAFPAQVRFIVHKDCLPLPESVFKKAIKESYDERTHKFKTELTVKQVKNLIGLFTPTPWLRPNGKSVVQEPTISPAPPAALLNEESLMRQRYPDNYGNSDTRGKSIPLHHENQFPDFHNSVPPKDPLFLTEQEYRNNGLQQGRPLLPTTAVDNISHTWEPNKLDVELKQLLRNPASTAIDSAVQQGEVNQPDPFFLSEKDYRTYGLRGPLQVPNAVPPMMTTNAVVRDSGKDTYDPYDESTTSLVNRYLAMPMATAVSAEQYPLAGREPHINDHPARTIHDGETAFASYNLREQSVLNQRSYSLNGSHEPSEFNRGTSLHRETNLTSTPVSNRYSFAGPSLSQHR